MIFSPLFIGFSTSTLHVLTGPDHLAAVTPLAVYEKDNVWRIGTLWGIGHILGMLILGSVFMMFREVLPLENIEKYSEQIVAIVLIGIGVWALYTYFRLNKLIATNPSKEELKKDALEEIGLEDEKNRKSNFAIFGIGILHGLAGISHFFLLLPTLGYETHLKSLLYFVGFAAGSIFAMTTYTWVIALLTRNSRSNRYLLSAIRLVGSIFAISVGLYLLYTSYLNV